MSDPFLGEIRMFGGNFAPQGWALCNGQKLSISQNAALFSLLGTYYGGDGVQTFALPDLRGRVPVNQGQGTGLSPYSIGQFAGSETITLTPGQMPQHSHTVNASSVAPTRGGTSPANAVPAATSVSGGPGSPLAEIYSTGTPNATMSPGMIAVAGGSQPAPIMQPYLAVSFIIALNGIFPSRS